MTLKTLKPTATVNSTVRRVLLIAIQKYLNDYNSSIKVLDALIASSELDSSLISLLRTKIDELKNISSERKQDLCALISLIENEKQSPIHLFYKIKDYLSEIEKGWWIFKGDSKLIRYFNAAIRESDPDEIDNMWLAEFDDSFSQERSESEDLIGGCQLTPQAFHVLERQISFYEAQVGTLKDEIRGKDEKIRLLEKQLENVMLMQTVRTDSSELIDAVTHELENDGKKEGRAKCTGGFPRTSNGVGRG